MVGLDELEMCDFFGFLDVCENGCFVRENDKGIFVEVGMVVVGDFGCMFIFVLGN